MTDPVAPIGTLDLLTVNERNVLDVVASGAPLLVGSDFLTAVRQVVVALQQAREQLAQLIEVQHTNKEQQP